MTTPETSETTAAPTAEAPADGAPAAGQPELTENDRDLDFVLGDNAKREVVRYADTIIAYLNEIDALKDEIKGAKVEAKGNGFDVNAIMKVVNAKRKGNHQERVEKETNERLYMLAADLPIAQ